MESDYILIIYRAISDVRTDRLPTSPPPERVIKLNETPNSRARSSVRPVNIHATYLNFNGKRRSGIRHVRNADKATSPRVAMYP